MNRNLQDLLDIGFTKVGEWRLGSDGLTLDLKDKRDASPALYAFIVDGDVKYVGKTVRPLNKRLYGYVKPGKSQRTNIRVRGKLLEALTEVECVQIYGFAEPKRKKHGRFLINMPAAIEDDIISQLRPEWNGGRERSGANHGSSVAGTTKSAANDLHSTGTSKHSSKSEPGISTLRPTFTVTIGKTYFNQGFFNVPVDFARYFAGHGAGIDISVSGRQTSIRGKINRTANSTDAPRIFGSSSLRDWFQSHGRLGATARIVVLSPASIEISLA